MKLSRFAKTQICCFLAFCLCAGYLWWFFSNHYTAHAQEYWEVKPYVFAELPHGRIYKTVHEGCELFIVEGDLYTNDGHTYAIATGRGCK